MKIPRTALVCLLAIAVSACVSVPSATPTQPATQTATNTLIATATTVPTVAPLPPTLVPTGLITPGPTLDPAQIVWSGSISPSVFRQLISQGSHNREAFKVPKSEQVFSLSAMPNIIAAYIYEVSSKEQRHARFLLYEPGGKWKDEVVPLFLYKMDLPLDWIADHNDYGNYDQVIRGLEAQFELPISPNKLSIGVFSANHCANADDVQQQLCAELARQGIELPVDYEAAEAMVMDQWGLAIQLTATQVGDIEQVVAQLNTSGTTWWEDNRFVLFYLPNITACLPGGDTSLCGTYIPYKMLIDTFGLLR